MNSTALEQRKTFLRLTPRQRHILIGKLLGDGHLETQNLGKTYRLKIEHAITQRPYVDWLASAFSGWLNTPPREWVRSVNGTSYRKCGFKTVSHPALRFYAHQFYANGRKVVPKQIERWLTPLTFAVWYMDDGSIKSHQTNGRILNTHGFTKSDVDGLIAAINHRYELHAIPRRQPEGWQIYIPSAASERLRRIIASHILPMFRYKLPRKETHVPKR